MIKVSPQGQITRTKKSSRYCMATGNVVVAVVYW